MLDMVSVAGQLRQMRMDLDAIGEGIRPRLDAAEGAWSHGAELGAGLRERVSRARTSWLVAEPLEPLGAYRIAAPDLYSIAASDGSQIFPDHHEPAHCFCTNTGLVEIDYRARTSRMTSRPVVSWLPADMYPVHGGQQIAADARVVSSRRFIEECRALEQSDAELLLMDGTLLLWWLDPDPVRLASLPSGDVKSDVLNALKSLLASARNRRALVAGYLSGARSTDVVSMLKVVLCTEDPVDCDRCPYPARKAWESARAKGLLPVPEKPCAEAEWVTDVMLMGRLLKPAHRSPRFRSSASVTGAYDGPIDFCYLNCGAEIARLEFPDWVDLDPLCAMVLDQCDKGIGYPVALSEAHEQAVVRAADRRAFMELVRRQAAPASVSVPSAKLMRKRLSVL